ncbi:MAG TPA: TetR family transcriptional regulator [Solirubrobacteraceae bacterium]|nr:TetR family transcriptional regulator [Solirubrobacteraceae bacterium]
MARLQRTAILEATIQVVADRGFARASVGLVTRRAGVSSRTFYELFGSLQGCFVAVLDAGAQHVARTILTAFQGETVWVDGMRSALAALLVLFESDPARARVWHVETLAAGQWALERRQRNLAALRSLIVEHWYPEPETDRICLASEGAMAGVLGVLHTRLLASSEEPLLTLLGPLMGLVVAPFVDADVRAREIACSRRLACEVLEGRPPASLECVLSLQSERLAPRSLRIPRSARMQQCLAFLAGAPGSSNSEIAAALGIVHSSQASKLLSQLVERGLVAKRSNGPGKRNAFTLTNLGQLLAD